MDAEHSHTPWFELPMRQRLALTTLCVSLLYLAVFVVWFAVATLQAIRPTWTFSDWVGALSVANLLVGVWFFVRVCLKPLGDGDA